MLAAGAAALAWPAGHQGQRPRASASHPPAAPSPSAASAAAAWVAAQVSHDAYVACYQPMCVALTAHGFPGTHLQRIRPASAYPVHADVVVVTPAVQRQFGTSLPTGWAPDVLASFGAGAGRVTVRLMAKHGTAAYRAAVRADLKGRQIAATTLLASKNITASAAARKQLLAGLVDSRVLLALSALSSAHPVDIVGFGTGYPGTSRDVPLRTVELAQDEPAAGMTRAGYLQYLLARLRAEPASLRPAAAGPVPSGGNPVFRITYQAPTPLGLLTPHPRPRHHP